MPRLTTIQGVKICVYSNDHVPPHIHAIFNEHEALIDIRLVTIINGYLPAKKQQIAFNYVRDNLTDLLEVFYQLNPQINRV